MKYLFVLIFSFFIIKNTATAQTSYGSLEGKMMDKKTEEGLIFASIILYKTGKKIPVTGASTDINGIYSIDSIPVGIYDVEFSYVGYKTIRVKKVEIKTDNQIMATVFLEEDYKLDGTRSYPRLFSIFDSGRVYTSGDIQNMPIKW